MGKTIPEAVVHTFVDWLAKEMPPGTYISSPQWWASRIIRKIEFLTAAQQQGQENPWQWAVDEAAVEDFDVYGANNKNVQDYARACVSSATEALRADVRRLQTKAAGAVDAARGYQRELAREYARAERLAEALRGLLDVGDKFTGDPNEDAETWVAANDAARAALDQEGGK